MVSGLSSGIQCPPGITSTLRGGVDEPARAAHLTFCEIRVLLAPDAQNRALRSGVGLEQKVFHVGAVQVQRCGEATGPAHALHNF